MLVGSSPPPPPIGMMIIHGDDDEDDDDSASSSPLLPINNNNNNNKCNSDSIRENNEIYNSNWIKYNTDSIGNSKIFTALIWK